MVSAAVLGFYRAMFPNQADPNLDGPWGPVLIDGLLEGNRAGRDVLNVVLQLEAEGLSASGFERVLLLVRQAAMDDCGNVPRTFVLRPKKHLRIPRLWPSPLALAQRREQSRDEFEVV